MPNRLHSWIDHGDSHFSWEPKGAQGAWVSGAVHASSLYGSTTGAMDAAWRDAEPRQHGGNGAKSRFGFGKGYGRYHDWRDDEDNDGNGGVPEPSPNPILPDFDSAKFKDGAPIDNPYFPLRPGSIYSHGATIEDEENPGEVTTERNDVYVAFEHKTILGVTTTVVRDTAYEDNRLVEDTLDWYAQDTKGNVWYLGEIAYNFRYDDDGNFIGTDTDGSWIANGEDVLPGYIMPSPKLLKALDNGYYQEFAPGSAEDQGDVVSLNAKVEIDIGDFKGVLQTLDTSQLDPDVLEFKYFEPGIGQVLTEEGLDEEGNAELSVELLGVRLVPGGEHYGFCGSLFRDRGDDDLRDVIVRDPAKLRGHEQPELEDFAGGAPGRYVTYLGGETESNNALGAYSFDLVTGAIGEAFILFSETKDLAPGTEVFVELSDGQGLGLFLLPEADELGLDLSAFEDGGLVMRNFASEGEANIEDRLAPQFLFEDTVLPLPALHALDANLKDDFNLLNPAGGIHAVELETEATKAAPDDDEITLLGFEDMFATDPEFEADFDDTIVAVSETQLSALAVMNLVDGLGLDSAELVIA